MVAVLAATSQPAHPLSGTVGSPETQSVTTPAVRYTFHTPIGIVGNANFTAANGVTGGNGTADNPYVITNWNITDSWSAGSGVFLMDTNAYVLIRDLYIVSTYTDLEPAGPMGLQLMNVSHVDVEQVTVVRNAYAFDLGLGGHRASNVTIRNSTAISNAAGVVVWDSSSDVHIEGDRFQASDIIVGDCPVSGHPTTRAVRVAVVGNNITDGGISVGCSTSVSVYRNNFFNSSVPAVTDSANYTWDDGYPSGGNYWSTYTGVDHCSGPEQNICTGRDGIGDTPYTFATGGVDHYPLMQPYSDAGPPPAGSTPPATAGWPLYAGIATIGVVIAAVIVLAWMRRRRRREGSPPTTPPPPPSA